MGWWDKDKEEEIEVVGKPASEDNEPLGDDADVVVEEVVEVVVEKPKKKKKAKKKAVKKAVKKVEAPKVVKCPNCKRPLVDNGNGFCKICGKKI